MSQFEGGYTGAVNSESERTARDFTNQHLTQIILQRALDLKLQNEAQQRQAQGRANAGSILPLIFPQGAPPAPLSADGAPPQAPMPGQPSVPMAAPTGAPPMMDDSGAPPPMPPGAPGEAMLGAGPENSPSPEPSAPPAAPLGWQASPSASPELGGQPQQPGAARSPRSRWSTRCINSSR